MDPNTALNNFREALSKVKPGPYQPGSHGENNTSGCMEWTWSEKSEIGQMIEAFKVLDECMKQGLAPREWLSPRHRHEFQGQALIHSHPHEGPHGYLEHPEDVGAPVGAGFDTDVQYRRLVSDLPEGYRWATEEECEQYDSMGHLAGVTVVQLTVDSTGEPYTQGEADLAVPIDIEHRQGG